jgi:DNA repair protein RecN (Recombination protein N)
MLRSLVIRNLVLIEFLELEFGPGLNVFTGETGAGKSILLDAFSLVLGGRAETALIRAGEKAARVEGLFDVGDHSGVDAYLEAHGLPVEEELVLARELSREARNRCWVNGSLTTRRTLEGLGNLLVDLHGQHDHQLLLRSAYHLSLVDDFGSRAHAKRLEEACSLISEYRVLCSRLEQREEVERRRRVERDHLEFQIQEIEEAGISPGEDERLHDDLRLLAGAEEIREDLGVALRLLEGQEGEGGLPSLLRASGLLSSRGAGGATLGDLGERLGDLIERVDEIRGEVAHLLETVQVDPERLAEQEARMGVIHRLTRKYGRNCEAVLVTLEELRERHRELVGGEAQGEADELRIRNLQELLQDLLPRLSREREKLARKMGTAIQEQVADLAMPEAQVAVRLSRQLAEEGLALKGETFRLFSDGLERAEILVATNPGEPPGPLARIASGGELSRVMLAMKAAMAKLDVVPIMVFDEIDAGVGGETGRRMAEKLQMVSQNCQCLCVTHLPSVAAAGTRQIQVEKSVQEGRTRVQVREVIGSEREKELARMLGGGKSSNSRDLARDLLAYFGTNPEGGIPLKKAPGKTSKRHKQVSRA